MSNKTFLYNMFYKVGFLHNGKVHFSSVAKNQKQNDILRPLNEDEMYLLQDIYKRSGDFGFHTLGLIYNQIDWDRRSREIKAQNPSKLWGDKVQTKYYTHRYGDLRKNGTFVSISGENVSRAQRTIVNKICTGKYFQDYQISYCTIEKNQKELHECLMETKLINYGLEPIFFAIRSDQVSHLYDIVKREKLDKIFDLDHHCYVVPKELAGNYQVEIPENVEIRPLQVQDATTMNDIWPHKYDGSIHYFEDTIELNGGLGIYSKDTNELYSWLLKNEFAGLGMGQTIESQRRHGYQEKLFKLLTKRIALEDDEDVNLFILDNNTKMQNLTFKAGGVQLSAVKWIQLRKPN